MKKKLLAGVAIVTLAVGGLMTTRQNSQSALSDLQMENIEVLTASEGIFHYGVLVQCQEINVLTCKAKCKRCRRTYYRSSGLPGYCVAVTGTCTCGNTDFERL